MSGKPSKPSKRHPFAAIEHRVIDSPAFAALTFSARALLVMFARQLTKNNNGHLQATFSYLHGFGFDSKTTLARITNELISHGFIYRSRMGGYQQGPSKYAVTWLSITDKDGLFLAGFKPYAWRDFEPDRKKTPPPKMDSSKSKNGMLSTPTSPENGLRYPPKNGHIELIPIQGSFSGGDPDSDSKDASEYSHEFVEFWKTYPRKQGKDKAFAAWKKKKPLLSEVLKALAWQMASDSWQEQKGKFIPAPTTYLNAGRWKDSAPEDKPFDMKEFMRSHGAIPS